MEFYDLRATVRSDCESDWRGANADLLTMLKPSLSVTVVTDGTVKAAKNFSELKRLAVYVGIPQEDEARQDTALARAAKLQQRMKHPERSKKLKRLMSSAEGEIRNAQLLFVHTHGSMAMGIPARPVIEPAIEFPSNKQAITEELNIAAKKQLDDKHSEAVNAMKRAGQEGQNAARDWFTNPANSWAPNKPETIRRKGSSRPLIDTGILRSSIIWVMGEDK